jgi:putative DNA primase/helicase
MNATATDGLDRFLGSIQRVKQTGPDEWIGSCPAAGHGQGRGDVHPSLSINRGNGSGALIKCHAGCRSDDVLAGAGLTWQDILPPRDEPKHRKTDTRKPAPVAALRTSTPKQKTPPKTITRYEIRDISGNLIAIHVRKDYPDGEKEMPWEMPDGTPKLVGIKLVDLPLYGIGRLPADAKEIVLAEGEKATDALLVNGIPAVGTVTGSSVTPSDDTLRVLLGRTVYLWPDNDTGGQKHMQQIGAALLRLGHTDVRVIDWKGAPEKGDAADLFALEGARDDFDALTDEAQPFTVETPVVDTSEEMTEDRPAFTEKFRGTDLWAALLFAFIHRQRAKYCWRRGGWFVYEGKRWLRSECGEIERLAKEIPRAILEIALAEQEAEERAKMFKFAAAMESASRIASVLNLAATEEGIALPPETFDAQPWLFNVANGTLDLRTGELLPHRPEDMLTGLSPAEWRGIDAKGERFEAFLSEAMDGDREKIDFLQRAAGYTLSADMREQVFLFAHGPEAAGKGTYIRAMADVMGTYARSTEIGTFLTARRDSVRNDVASLVGSRLVTASEPEDGQVFDEGLIKILTGQDKTSARFLFREAFEFAATFKLWLQGNHRPHIRSTGGAMWRRLLIVPFTRTVPEEKRDKTLGDRLRTTEERAGILAWMAQGCREWQRAGLRPPDSVRAAVAEYRAAEDRLAPFLEEVTAASEHGQVPAGQLYAKYKAWAETNGERPMPKRSFGLRLEEKGYKPGRTTGGRRVWNGILLVDRGARNDASDASTPKFPKSIREKEITKLKGKSLQCVTNVTPISG